MGSIVFYYKYQEDIIIKIHHILNSLFKYPENWTWGGDCGKTNGFAIMSNKYGIFHMNIDSWIDDCLETGQWIDKTSELEAERRGVSLARQWYHQYNNCLASGYWIYNGNKPYGITWILFSINHEQLKEYRDEDIFIIE